MFKYSLNDLIYDVCTLSAFAQIGKVVQDPYSVNMFDCAIITIGAMSFYYKHAVVKTVDTKAVIIGDMLKQLNTELTRVIKEEVRYGSDEDKDDDEDNMRDDIISQTLAELVANEKSDTGTYELNNQLRVDDDNVYPGTTDIYDGDIHVTNNAGVSIMHTNE